MSNGTGACIKYLRICHRRIKKVFNMTQVGTIVKKITETKLNSNRVGLELIHMGL